MIISIRGKPSIGGRQTDYFRRGVAIMIWRNAAIAAALIFVILLPQITNPYYVKIVAIGLIFAYVSSAWNIIGGYGGQLSIGHSIFFGIGSYAIGLFAVYK